MLAFLTYDNMQIIHWN